MLKSTRCVYKGRNIRCQAQFFFQRGFTLSERWSPQTGRIKEKPPASAWRRSVTVKQASLPHSSYRSEIHDTEKFFGVFLLWTVLMDFCGRKYKETDLALASLLWATGRPWKQVWVFNIHRVMLINHAQWEKWGVRSVYITFWACVFGTGVINGRIRLWTFSAFSLSMLTFLVC